MYDQSACSIGMKLLFSSVLFCVLISTVAESILKSWLHLGQNDQTAFNLGLIMAGPFAGLVYDIWGQKLSLELCGYTAIIGSMLWIINFYNLGLWLVGLGSSM